MNRNQILLIIILFITVPLIWFFVPESNPGTMRSLEGVTLSNLNGEKFRISSIFANKKTLLVFWSITCGSCIEEIPFIMKLQNQFRDKITVIGVHPAGFPLKKIQKFVRKYTPPITYLIAVDDESRLSQSFEVSVLPKVVLVDERGRQLYSHVGYEESMEKEVEASILKLL
ncbi:MAG: TlpA family protein disulfide reductase [Candidatus Riflebacteria bacterium]|nr:TlpA family protein disulfide reductase [Candidatus Riflebacteria bacterium]